MQSILRIFYQPSPAIYKYHSGGPSRCSISQSFKEAQTLPCSFHAFRTAEFGNYRSLAWFWSKQVLLIYSWPFVSGPPQQSGQDSVCGRVPCCWGWSQITVWLRWGQWRGWAALFRNNRLTNNSKRRKRAPLARKLTFRLHHMSISCQDFLSSQPVSHYN